MISHRFIAILLLLNACYYESYRLVSYIVPKTSSLSIVVKNSSKLEQFPASSLKSLLSEEEYERIVIEKLYQLDILCDRLSPSTIKQLSHLCVSSNITLSTTKYDDYTQIVDVKSSLGDIFGQKFRFQDNIQCKIVIERLGLVSDQQQLVLLPSLKISLDGKSTSIVDTNTAKAAKLLNIKKFMNPKVKIRLNDKDDADILKMYSSLKARNMASKTFRTKAQRIVDKFIRSYQPYRILRVKIYDDHAGKAKRIVSELQLDILASYDELWKAIYTSVGREVPLSSIMIHIRGKVKNLDEIEETTLLRMGCVPPGFIINLV